MDLTTLCEAMSANKVSRKAQRDILVALTGDTLESMIAGCVVPGEVVNTYGAPSAVVMHNQSDLVRGFMRVFDSEGDVEEYEFENLTVIRTDSSGELQVYGGEEMLGYLAEISTDSDDAATQRDRIIAKLEEAENAEGVESSEGDGS